MKDYFVILSKNAEHIVEVQADYVVMNPTQSLDWCVFYFMGV